MEMRFEDHRQFQRAAALASLCCGALAAGLPLLGLVPAAAVAWLLVSRSAFLLPLSGALLLVLFALARRASAQASGTAGPSGVAIALSAALGAVGVMLAALLLPPLAAALAAFLPGWLATGASGAVFGLWAGCAAAPLHIAVGTDAVEARLLALRPSLTPEVRGLAERAAQAAEALEGQLEHFSRVHRAREGALARLHEEVANLERARFSLALLRGGGEGRGAVELDLLHDRLQQGALGLEAEEELAAPSGPARVE